jgi:hypothetical protein
MKRRKSKTCLALLTLLASVLLELDPKWGRAGERNHYEYEDIPCGYQFPTAEHLLLANVLSGLHELPPASGLSRF